MIGKRYIRFIMLGILILSMMAIPIFAAKTQRTGLDVAIEEHGFTLESYQLSDKYQDYDHNKIVILDIVIKDGFDNLYSYTWVMTYEKYLERREKV